jgi:ligand-binding sensor domain-containing protein
MKKLYTLLLLVFSLNCCAQYRDLYFEHLNVENGLPENMINVLMQDKLGYIWIGTQNGLVRYDGYQVKVYTLGSEIKNESKDYGISEVVEDKKGVLWVLTRSLGLFRYNRETDDFTQCKPGTIYSYYDSMICDDHDNIWIRYYAADNTGNVSHLEKFNTKNQQFTALPWLVTGMAKSSTGNVWFGTSKGLACYQTTTGNIAQTVFAIPGAPKTAGIYSLYEPASQPGILYFSF